MSSHYTLKVISNKEIKITDLLYSMRMNSSNDKERIFNIVSLEVNDLKRMFASVVINTPMFVNVNGTLFPNIDRTPRQMNVMTDVHDEMFMYEDNEVFYKDGLFSAYVLTSTRIEDGFDVIEYFKNVSITLNDILENHDIVTFYQDDSKDVNNYFLISGEVKNITTGV